MAEGLRTLMKPVDRCRASWDELQQLWAVDGSGWSNIVLPGGDAVGWEGSIDLTGYAAQDKTMFFTGQTISEVGDWTTTNVDVIGLQCLEVVSMVPLDLTILATDMANNIYPGMPRSDFNQEHIVQARYRFLTPFTNQAAAAVGLNFPFVARQQEFGTGEPTTSNKLYCYVVVTQISLDLKNDMFIPSRRFVLAGVPLNEPDLEYLMRLRRSFVELDR